MTITQQRLAASLAELARGLRDAGVPFAIAGAHAVAIHGHARATTDIDVLLRAADRTAAEAVLVALGYRLDSGSASFAHFARRPFAALPTVVERVDLLISTRALGERAIGRAARIALDWHGVALPVVPVDTLILMKLMAMSAAPRRHQDLADARALLELNRPALDLDSMRRDADEIGADVRARLEALLGDCVGDSRRAYGEADVRI